MRETLARIVVHGVGMGTENILDLMTMEAGYDMATRPIPADWDTFVRSV